MLPDRVSNPGPLTYESGALPIALRGPASGGLHLCINNTGSCRCEKKLERQNTVLVNGLHPNSALFR